eukprot:2781604-Amphidinium_carterae.1
MSEEPFGNSRPHCFDRHMLYTRICDHFVEKLGVHQENGGACRQEQLRQRAPQRATLGMPLGQLKMGLPGMGPMALSSGEAEWHACCSIGAEMLYIRQILVDVGMEAPTLTLNS